MYAWPISNTKVEADVAKDQRTFELTVVGPDGTLWTLVPCGASTFLARSTDEGLSFPVLSVSGKPLTIKTVGDAYRFVSNDGVIEWIEVYGLRKQALAALQAASHNAMLSRRATDAVRALLAGAKLL